MLEHILIISAGDLPREPLEDALNRFARDIHDCPGLVSISWGRNVNPTGLQRGCDYVCSALLDSIDTLQTDYWNHPAHHVLLEELPALCAERFALDFDVAEGETHGR
ncbi:Dabb family protein [Microbacterium sp. LWH7-1.2]|jgi:hypothetical protein|uniref:Dabb family protein n=1 Tax=Microbacterium sp. LWH7-1.2 TaxID=3135257 RepID=UPI003139F33B